MDEIKEGDRVRLAPTALMKRQQPELIGREFTVTEVRNEADGILLDGWVIADGYQLEVVKRVGE